jgi:hypothetical protein
MKKIISVKIILTSICILVVSTSACYATILPAPSYNSKTSGGTQDGCPSGSNCGNYRLDDFAAIAINVARFILGISGSLALVFFVYGGFMFLISAGQSDKINSAKQILINSIIGIVIIFSAYMIIGFVITKVLKVNNSEEWYKVNWFQNS